MQPDRFTVKSQEAVAAAQALAAERRNPEVTPAHLLVALLRQEEGIAVPILQKLNVDVGALTAEAVRAVEDLPKLAETAEVRPSSTLVAVLQGAEKEMAKHGDSYLSVGHLLLALADSSSGVSRPPARARRAREGGRRGPGARPRHLPRRRGQRPGAGEIRPRPDRRGRGGQARPGDRARRGDPPRDPGPLPAHQEQPGADRRPRASARRRSSRASPSGSSTATCPRASATAA